MFHLFIQDIAGSGWSRWAGLPLGSTKISQAHAQADTGIMYYLIDNSNGAAKLVTDTIEIDDKKLEVLSLQINDLSVIIDLVKELAIMVQGLSSQAVKQDIDDFFKVYASDTRDTKYAEIVTKMRDTKDNGIIQKVQIFPEWEPVYEEADIEEANKPLLVDVTNSASYSSTIVDARPIIPTDPFEYLKDLFEKSL